MCIQTFITICHSVQENGHFQNLELRKPRPTINVILQSPGLDLVNINVAANICQNIPNGLRAMGIFRKLSGHKIFANCPVTDIPNLELCKASTSDKLHLTIPRARYCQYKCVCKIQSLHSAQFKRYGHFHWELGKASNDDKCHFAIPCARSCQYQWVCKTLSKYS